MTGIKDKKWEWKTWPVILILLGTLGVFGLLGARTGDFLAYFNSGGLIRSLRDTEQVPKTLEI